MNIKKFIFLSLSALLIGVNFLYSQEVKKEKKKMYVSDDGKIYFQKSMEVYLWVSPSAENSSNAHILVPEKDSINHFHLDTEGKNTIRSPWRVDPKTGEYVTPREDVIFDIYADGITPQTKIQFLEAPKYVKNNVIYYGKGLKVNLNINDSGSGVESTFISVNNSNDYIKFENQINIDKEKENIVNYYSVDNVGNSENIKSKKFIVDLTPPISKFELLGTIENNILSPNAQIVLKSEDNLSGVKNIKYKIGDRNFKTYFKPIDLATITDGEIEIFFYATDNVNNTEVEKSTNSEDAGSGTTGSLSSLKLYVDKIAPEVNATIKGDQYKGKYLFVSERTEVELNATDNKAGIEKITFGVNAKSRTNEYKNPFKLLQSSGVQYVNFAAIDKVKNWAKAQTKTIYMDKTSPHTSVKYSQPKFENRDTLFITKDTKIKFTSFENESGLNALNYSTDNGSNKVYTDAITIEKDGYHKINYYGIDNVNNTEESKFTEFVIDNQAPKIKYSYSIEPLGNEVVDKITYQILPSNTMIFLAATDNASGVKDIQYSINKGEWKSKNIIQYFKPGKFVIDIVAYDSLGNKSEEQITFKIIK